MAVWGDGYEGCWTWNAVKVALDGDLLIGKKVGDKWKVFRIDRASGAKKKPTTVWVDAEIQSEKGQEAFERVMGTRFSHPPKALGLLERILRIATTGESIILDCFAGSGTTGHAVMLANAKDAGERRFILVEGEPYADSITAERARRVINGFPFTGKIRDELLRESLTWTKIRNSTVLIAKVEKTVTFHQASYDSVSVAQSDGFVIVTGERVVDGFNEGLGGHFSFCELGPAFNLDRMLTGESLPAYLTLGSWLFHTATGEVFTPAGADEDTMFLGESSAYYCWLVYKPDLAFLKSSEAALTLSLAERVAASKPKGKKHLVFAPAKYAPNSKLLPLGVEYAPLPFALYRIEKG